MHVQRPHSSSWHATCLCAHTSSCVIVLCRPDYFLPWQNHPKRESTGTGFVIRDRLILTNAHVVADQTYVTVKRHGSGTKYRAGESSSGLAGGVQDRGLQKILTIRGQM